jgi:fimbrial chaperone protein
MPHCASKCLPLINRISTWILFGLFFLLPELAECNSWRVIPIRLDMDQRTRSGVVTIVNDSEAPMSFSVEPLEWTQDEQGNDLYTETKDILSFPKSLTVEPRSERIVRTGIKVPAVDTEKTYRLFIKQESDPQHRSATAVAIVIRFGVPIFSKPLNETVSGEITKNVINNGTIAIGIKNNGNVHFRVQSLKLEGLNLDGASIWSQEIPGTYFLTGTEREFSLDIPEQICSHLNSLNVEVTSDRVQLSRQINVDKSMCLTP